MLALTLYLTLFTFSLLGLQMLAIKHQREQHERLIKDQLLIWQAAANRKRRGGSAL